MKKIILSLIIIFLFIPITKASHVIGGDLSIQWVSQNNYHIKLRMYRDDAFNGLAMPSSVTVGVYDAVTHTQIATQNLPIISSAIVNIGDACFTPDTNTLKVEEGIFESQTNLYLADNPNGYYLSSEVFARNGADMNFTNSVNTSMTWFATMADPAIGQNSSPDFSNYPADPYLCVNTPKYFQYPVTDLDGDSLVYSFVTPLDSWVNVSGTSAGSGSYPYYPELIWASGYSLSNIVGGSNPMTIDPTTGLIVAEPSTVGIFNFAVRIEEYRDTSAAQNGPKVKIGETRRDVQYHSLNCTTSNNTAGFTYVDNGNANYSFTNTSTGSFTLSRWNFGDGNLSPAHNPNHTFSNNGTYAVVLAIADSTGANCSMDYAVSTINVTGVTNPLACNSGFTIYPDTIINNFIVVNSSTGNNLTYHWDFGDGDTSNLQYPSHTYQSGGPYYLCLTIDNGAGCSDMFCDSIASGGVVFKQAGGFTINTIGAEPPNSISEINAIGKISLFPNPTSENISFTNNLTGITQISIIDVTGKIIKTITKNTNVINVRDLSKGIYFLRIESDNNTVTKKFIKE